MKAVITDRSTLRVAEMAAPDAGQRGGSLAQ